MAEKPIDETVPGGRYMVGDQLVNANGEPINESAAGAGAESSDPLAFLSADQRASLAAAGFPDADAMRRASDEQLDAVDGIGPATVERIRAAVGREA